VLTETGVVYKYFDLIDGFIRVRVLSGDGPLRLPPECRDRPPDRREYRRLVVRACVVGLDEVVLPRVQQIYPEDAAAAEDLLYQICVDVNPKLEIHTVALPAEDDLDPDEERSTRFRERARRLERRLLREIIGQDHAVARVCRAVRKAASGLQDPQRPIGAFLLVGRTGTGKTELSKALARHLYEAENLVRIDCSEYALPHETAKLIGAPPGYVGHNEGGTLTEALLRDPHAVVLFDEIEKGHEKLHNMLLQILDEGRLTDSKGNTVSFRHALVLMTSNVGTEDYRRAAERMGFERGSSLDQADYESLTQEALRRNFKPELLNRIDDILVFRALGRQECCLIADMQLKRLRSRLETAGVELRWTEHTLQALVEAGYSEEYGAREIRRAVDRLVEEPLATAILDGEFGRGDRITVRSRRGSLVLDRRPAAEPRTAGGEGRRAA